MITLADKITMARLFIAPVAVAAYILLPIEYNICFWVCGILCAIAEFTDFFDGAVARKRKEVSDFGKLADPFCDVFYRLFIFMIFLVPAGGVGYPASVDMLGDSYWLYLPPIYLIEGGANPVYGSGLVPVLPVMIMVIREIVVGALRSMAASKNIILAARQSGKVKAWAQGIAISFACGMPAFFGNRVELHLDINTIFAWTCAAISFYSICEYLLINRAVLKQLVARKEFDENSAEENTDI